MEESTSRQLTVQGWRLFIEPAANSELVATATVIARGLEFRVKGRPDQILVRGRVHHIEADLELIDDA